MIELLYTSKAVLKMSRVNLLQLLTASRTYNEQYGITGMLIYSNGYFAQLLEGEADAIHELYKAIKEDTRHTAVVTFYEGEIAKKSFAEWTMGFRILGDTEKLHQIPGFENIMPGKSLINTIVQNPNKGRKLFNYLHDFLLSDPDSGTL